MEERLTQDLVVQALQQALGRRKPDTGIVFHSDRGSQYAGHDVRNTSWSAPVLRIGTLILLGPPLEFLPYHRNDRFPRSTQEPGSDSRYLYAGCRPSSKQAPLGLILESRKPPSSDIVHFISTPQK